MLDDRVARSVLDELPDAVTVQDERGRLLYANREAARAIGYAAPEELLAAQDDGTLAQRFVVRDEGDEPVGFADLPGRRALASGGAVGPVLLRWREVTSGDERWSLVSAMPLTDRSGQTLAINVWQDVTADKRAQLADRFLARSAELLAHTLDLDETLGQISRLAVGEVADWCAVDLVGDDGEIVHAALSATTDELRDRALELRSRFAAPGGDTGVATVLRTGSSELYSEVTDEMLVAQARGPEHLAAMRELRLRSAAVVPMIARGRPIGAITLATSDPGRSLTERDVAVLSRLAGKCALAVENARLYAGARDLALTLQASLLPPDLPRIPGVRMAARYRPAGAGLEVGGDFYDVFALEDDTWAVVVGDVCGKGAAAAAMTALARYTTRAVAGAGRAPAAVLADLNDAVLGAERPALYATALYAVLRTSEPRTVTLATAGHPLPILIRADGSAQAVGEAGNLLGLDAQPRLTDVTVDLGPGDRLLAFTDGLTDARAPGHPLSEAELREVLARHRGEPVETMAQRIEEAALGPGAEARDDIALVLLEMV